MLATFGEQGIVVAAMLISFLIPLVNFACITVLVRFGGPGTESALNKRRAVIRAVLTNPVVLACILGLALHHGQLVIPQPLASLLDILGRASLPLGLLAVGAALQPRVLRHHSGTIMAVTLYKLLLNPLLVWLFCQIFALPPLTTKVVVIFAALPGSALSSILARQLGGDAPLVAGITTALGIGVDEYEAAADTARQQVLDEAVSEGVLTEEQAERMSERLAEGWGPGTMGAFGGRHGGMMGRGGYGGMMAGSQGSLLTVAAEELGMSVEDLTAALQDGKSIAAVASEKGVDPQAIADAFMSERAEWLAEAVADGRMTQEQADYMLEHMEAQILEHLDAPFSGAGGPGDCFGRQGGSWRGGPGMMGPGGIRSYPGTDES